MVFNIFLIFYLHLFFLIQNTSHVFPIISIYTLPLPSINFPSIRLLYMSLHLSPIFYTFALFLLTLLFFLSDLYPTYYALPFPLFIFSHPRICFPSSPLTPAHNYLPSSLTRFRFSPTHRTFPFAYRLLRVSLLLHSPPLTGVRPAGCLAYGSDAGRPKVVSLTNTHFEAETQVLQTHYQWTRQVSGCTR